MLGTTLGGRYQICRYLGGGGFGRTYLAHDQHLPGTPACVVKQLKPRINHPRAYDTACRLFNREAEVLYVLGEHDQVPRLFAHFEEQQEFYLVQEFVDGEVLSRTLRTGYRLEEADVINLLKELMEILIFVHSQNVIHRDIKPSNLMRRKDGTLVMIDFGGVKQFSQDSTTEGTVTTVAVGSAGYMPNEQLAGRPRYSSDIYAAGMVALRAVTGCSPAKLPENIRTGEIDWRDRAPQISDRFADILERMTRYDFRERYATAQATLTALKDLEWHQAEARKEYPPDDHAEYLDDIAYEMPASPMRLNFTSDAVTSVISPINSQLVPSLKVPHLVPSGQENVSDDSCPFAAPEAVQRDLSEIAPVSKAMASERPENLSTSLMAKPAGRAEHPENVSTSLMVKTEETLTEKERQRTDGDYCFQSQQYERAIDYYSTLLHSNPDDYILWFKKAMALEYLNRHEDAIACYRSVLELQPQDYLAWSKLGKALENLEKYDEAVDAYTQVLQIQPQNYWAWHDQGRAFESAQHIETAIASYERAIQLKPDFQLAIDSRKRLLSQLNQVDRLYHLQHYDEALQSCLETVATNPSDPLAWLMQGMTFENAQQYPEAIQAYDRVINLDPTDYLAWFRRGGALEKLGQYADAAQSYSTVTQLQNDNHWAWNDLGRVLETLHQYEQSLAAYEKSLRLQDGFEPAVAGRDRVLRQFAYTKN
ncbi:MAG: serine/threonine-protein kinase [Cyanobacteria bacterium P01_F01_bin.150]